MLSLSFLHLSKLRPVLLMPGMLLESNTVSSMIDQLIFRSKWQQLCYEKGLLDEHFLKFDEIRNKLLASGAKVYGCG